MNISPFISPLLSPDLLLDGKSSGTFSISLDGNDSVTLHDINININKYINININETDFLGGLILIIRCEEYEYPDRQRQFIAHHSYASACTS
jgi:hypothetical protein